MSGKTTQTREPLYVTAPPETSGENASRASNALTPTVSTLKRAPRLLATLRSILDLAPPLDRLLFPGSSSFSSSPFASRMTRCMAPTRLMPSPMLWWMRTTTPWRPRPTFLSRVMWKRGDPAPRGCALTSSMRCQMASSPSQATSLRCCSTSIACGSQHHSPATLTGTLWKRSK